MGTSQLIQDAIAEKTKELLRSRPIEKISVTTICDSAGIGRKTFYRYFKDKYDVVNRIYYNDYFANMPRDPAWSVWDYFDIMIRHIYSDPCFYRNAFRIQGQNSYREYGKELLREIIDKDYAEAFPDERSKTFFVSHALDMTFDACMDWLGPKPALPPEEFGRQYKENFLAFSRVSERLIQQNLK